MTPRTDEPTARTTTVLAVDLGKTSCRLRVTRAGAILGEARGPGAPGLAEQDGDASSLAAILAAFERLPEPTTTGITHCGIGAAGVEAGEAAARRMVERLSAQLEIPVAVVNDALAAHIGAFGGGEGTILIAGTGSIAFHLGPDAPLKQVDGWGPWLGDEGSGRWIGQQGLKRALRYADRRGAYTALFDAATALVGDLAMLPAWISETGEPARRLASFAPAVLDHAQRGDTAAADIVGTATSRLAATAAAAAPPDSSVAIVGGLSEHPYFREHLAIALSDRGLRAVQPLGGPLEGATRLATDAGLIHEQWAIRSSEARSRVRETAPT